MTPLPSAVSIVTLCDVWEAPRREGYFTLKAFFPAPSVTVHVKVKGPEEELCARNARKK